MGPMAYRDSFQETGWTRFLKALSASFRLGRFFDVEVRVFWVALIVMPLILMRGARGLPFVEGLTYIVLTTLALYLIIWTHEMGHIFAGRRYGIPTPLITLSPLGGVAHMSAGAPSPGKEIVIALAGPVVHLFWLVPVAPLYFLIEWGTLRPSGWMSDPGYNLLWTLFWLNVGLMAFNLLPCFPMDGGRALRGFLAKKMHPNRATLIATKIGMVAAVVFMIAGIFFWITQDNLWGPILAMIGISNYMACKQERLATQYSAGPYMQADPLQPWQTDPEAWKRGGSFDPLAKPDKRAEKLQKKAEQRARKEAEEAAALDAEVDRVLAKVSEVGMAGLSRKEKDVLKRASERRRGK